MSKNKACTEVWVSVCLPRPHCPAPTRDITDRSKRGPRGPGSMPHSFSLGKWARAGTGRLRAPPLGGGMVERTPRS